MVKHIQVTGAIKGVSLENNLLLGRALCSSKTPSTPKNVSGASCPVYLHPEQLITKIENGEKTSWMQLLFGKPPE